MGSIDDKSETSNLDCFVRADGKQTELAATCMTDSSQFGLPARRRWRLRFGPGYLEPHARLQEAVFVAAVGDSPKKTYPQS